MREVRQPAYRRGARRSDCPAHLERDLLSTFGCLGEQQSPSDDSHDLPILAPEAPLKGGIMSTFSGKMSGRYYREVDNLLYGLLLSGQIRFRRINGWQKLEDVIGKSKKGELILMAS